MRRALALSACVWFCVAFVLWVTAHYAHAARTHVEVSVAAAVEIVQVFVNCNPVYVYRSNEPVRSDVDLGWLNKGAILTFQVRGRKLSGFYALSFTHSSHLEHVGSAGSKFHRAHMSPAEVVFARSYTVDGLPLQALPCQADAPQSLEFARSAAALGAARGGPDKFMDWAASLVPIFESALVILGALTLLFAAAGGTLASRQGRRTLAEFLLGVIGVTLGVLWTTAKELDLVAPVCLAVGLGAFLWIVYRLLAQDIDAVCAWRVNRSSELAVAVEG